jgi:hypothetical protein
MINDNSIKQGFLFPIPNSGGLVKLAEKTNGLNRDYLVIQNLSSSTPIYISFHKPRVSSGIGQFAIEGMIELLPKQIWFEQDSIHQGEIYSFSDNSFIPEIVNVNGVNSGINFISVNYNGAYDYFKNKIYPVLFDTQLAEILYGKI